MRLIARSEATEPSDSTTRADGAPKRPSRNGSIATRSPSSASPPMPAGTRNSRPAARFSTGSARPEPSSALRKTAKTRAFMLVEDLDHPARIGRRLARRLGVELDTHQDARADPRRGRRVASGPRSTHEDARRRSVLAPFGGPGDEFAVPVALGDIGDHERRQAALHDKGLAAARDRALVLEVLDEKLEAGLGVALHAEGAGDVALGDMGGRLLAVRRRRAADEGDQLLARRQGGFTRRAGASAFRRAAMGIMILQTFHSGGDSHALSRTYGRRGAETSCGGGLKGAREADIRSDRLGAPGQESIGAMRTVSVTFPLFRS